MESLFLYKISFIKQHVNIAIMCNEKVFSSDFLNVLYINMYNRYPYKNNAFIFSLNS